MRGPITNFRWHVVTAVLATMVAAAYGVALFGGAGGLPSFGETYRVTAVLPSASSLAAQSRVTEAGVVVGRVVSVERVGSTATAEFEIDDKHAPLPDDTRVALRLRTLVGEKSIELSPGVSNRMVPSGGMLSMGQTNEFVEVDSVLSQLRGRTRDRARKMVQSLGGALNDKGAELNRLLAGTSGLISDGAPPVHTLADDHEQVKRLVSNLGQMAAQIGDRGDALRTLAERLDQTATAVASRDDEVRATLGELPPTLAQVRQTSGVLRTASVEASPVISRLAGAVDGLSPAVEALAPAARVGQDVMAELGPAAPRLERTLAAVERLSGPASSTLPRLKSILCQANPALDYLSPYGPELASLFANLGSAVNAYDANGHIARLYIGLNENSLFGVAPKPVVEAENELFQMGILQKIRLLGYNPYPAPGTASDTVVGRNSSGPQTAENKYQRIRAAC